MGAPKGNKFAEGCETSGRPPKYSTAEQMQVLIDKYFESCFEDYNITDEEGNILETKRRQIEPFTITGLCIVLDMDRDTLVNYSKDQEFFGAIKKARMKCQNYAEKHLFTAKNPSGVIFNLKNNYGWKDKTEQEVTVSSNIAERLQRAKERKELAMQTINVED